MSNEMDMTKLGFFGRIRKFFWKLSPIRIHHNEHFRQSFPDCDIEIWNLISSLNSLPRDQQRSILQNRNVNIGSVRLVFDSDGDLSSIKVDNNHVHVSRATRKFIMVKMGKLVGSCKDEERKGAEVSLKNSIQASYLETKGL